MKNLNVLHIFYNRFNSIQVYPILNLTNLTDLTLGRCHENLDEFLIILSDTLKNLTIIQLTVSRITDVGILALTKLDKLETIMLLSKTTAQREVTDASVEKFKNMKVFGLSNCPMITDNSISRVLNNSPNLEKIYLVSTAVTPRSVQQIIDIMRIRTNGTPLYAAINLPKEVQFKPEGKIPPNLELEIL